MKVRTPNQNELALLDLLSCEQSELRKHSSTVYEWRGKYLEVLTKTQRDRSEVPESWYTHFDGWYFREMGKKAAKVKRIKRGKNG